VCDIITKMIPYVENSDHK